MKSFLIILFQLFFLPHKWRKRLVYISVPQLLDEIEAAIKIAPPIKLPLKLIIRMVKYRVKVSIRWRKNACLLGCMLLSFFLSCAGCKVTFHLGCNLKNEDLTGHSWISSPELVEKGRFQSQGDMHEIYARSFVKTNGTPHFESI